MIAYSDHDKDLLLANTARTYSRLTFYKNGQQLIVCTEDDYLQEWDYEDYRYVPEQGFVGQFVERILDGKLINLPLDIDISDAEFKMEVGIKDPELETVNYYDYGNFLITKVSDTDTNGTVSFEACDYTKKFNKVYEDRIEYPCTAGQLLMDVCDQAGVGYNTGSGTAVVEYMYITEGDAEYPAGAYSLYRSDTDKYLNFTSTRPLKRLESIANITSDNRYLYHNYIDTDGTPKQGAYRYTQATTATGTILQSTMSYDGMFTNCDFVIENNQFGENATCRDVIKAIAQLAMSWARVGIDNKLYLDFHKRTTSNVNTYTTLDTDNYYAATKTGDTYGPVTDVVIGMSSVEGENITKTGPLLDGTEVEGSNLYIEDGIEDKTTQLTLKGDTSQASQSLPDAYTQVTYIQSSGGSAIDSGYKPTSEHLTISFKFNCQTGFFRSLTGAANSDDQEFAIQFFNGRLYVGTSRALLIKTYDTNTDYETTIDAYNGTLTQILNGETTSTSYTGTLYKGASVGIFHTKTTDGWHNLYTDSVRIYYYRLYDNNVLVRDFVPCYRNSDNAIGMYDLIEGKFYTNARNEGAFTKGSDTTKTITPNPNHPEQIKVVTGDNTIEILNINKVDLTPLTIEKYNSSTVSQYVTSEWVYDNELGRNVYHIARTTSSGAVYPGATFKLPTERFNAAGKNWAIVYRYKFTTNQPNVWGAGAWISFSGRNNWEAVGINSANQVKKMRILQNTNGWAIGCCKISKDNPEYTTYPTTSYKYMSVCLGSSNDAICELYVSDIMVIEITDAEYNNDNYTPPDFVPYQSQTYPLYLGVENLCNITSVTGYGYSSGLPTSQAWDMVIDNYTTNSITYHVSNAGYLYALTNVMQLEPSTQYTISFSRTTTATNNQFFIYDYNNGTYSVNYRDNNTNVFKQTFTTNAVGQIALAWGYSNTATGTTTISDIQIEKGSKANSYTPYGQTPIELCKIGDYQDYLYRENGKWYKHAKIGKRVLSENEITVNTSYTNVEYAAIPRSTDDIHYGNYTYGNVLSYFTHGKNMGGNPPSGWDSYIQDGLVYNYATQAYYWMSFAKNTGLAAIKQKISGMKYYYVLANPVVTEITDANLIEQLETAYHAKLHNGVNNIATNTSNEEPIIHLIYNATETTLEILDNPLTYTEELRRIAINSADKLLGLTYTPVEVDTIGYPWLDGDDYCEINDLDGDTYYTYPFNRVITYKGYIDSSIRSIADGKVQTEYKYEGDVDRRISRTEIIVDKHEGEIRMINEHVDHVDGDISDLETQYSDVLNQVDTANTTITELSSSVQQISSSTYTKTEIQQIARGEGPDGVAVSVVSTMAGQFDINGMHYAKSGAPTQSTINQFGVEVNESNEDGTPGASLLYAGYDYDTTSPTNGESVVKVANINISDWTNIGLHGRFQDYTDEDNNEGIGFFLV